MHISFNLIQLTGCKKVGTDLRLVSGVSWVFLISAKKAPMNKFQLIKASGRSVSIKGITSTNER